MEVTEYSIDRLIIEIFRQSFEDIIELGEQHPVARDAAVFLLNNPLIINIPHEMYTSIGRMADVPFGDDEIEVILAESYGGKDWEYENGFSKPHCLYCGRSARWRAVFSSPRPEHPASWRYDRTENHIPLCGNCWRSLGFVSSEHKRAVLAAWLWQGRFEAFLKWHEAFKADALPRWNKIKYPLWPSCFGDSTWEGGDSSPISTLPRLPDRYKVPVLERRLEIGRLIGVATRPLSSRRLRELGERTEAQKLSGALRVSARAAAR